MSRAKILRKSVGFVGAILTVFMMGNQAIHVTDGNYTNTMLYDDVSCENFEKFIESNETTTCTETTIATTTTSLEETKTTTKQETTTTIVTTTTEHATTTIITTATQALTTVSPMATCWDAEIVDAIVESIDDIVVPMDEAGVSNYSNDVKSFETELIPENDAEHAEEDLAIETEAYTWTGTILTKKGGIVPADETPSGLKETWYNLPMFGCLNLMGLPHDGYEVRADGVKTYNGYVMVASPDLEKWPKGTYIETTRGMGYVVDECPSGSLDIAVDW